MKKSEIIEMPTIGYWSALGGLEVKKIEYGINDYCLCVSGAWNGKKTTHRVKIYDEGYIRLHGYKFEFSDCLRV